MSAQSCPGRATETRPHPPCQSATAAWARAARRP